jgi:Ca2+-binding RTX toxin-like protein
MFRQLVEKLLPRSRRRPVPALRPSRYLPELEPLAERILPAVTASFKNGVLTVNGDARANNIVISRNAAGRILVNGGAVKVQGAVPRVAKVALIQVFGRNGNDRITLNEAKGPLPRARLIGGQGNDILTGGAAADLLFGGLGNNTLLGMGGADTLLGGSGHDTLIGGDGHDFVAGLEGDDRMIWNPGDDSDVFEGGVGVDAVEVNGDHGAESFTINAAAGRVHVNRIDPAPFTIDIGTSENLAINANGGDDAVTGGNGLAGEIQITIDGGAGNDTLAGGDGVDVLLGGDGNDSINGKQGNDVALLGAGDDVFIWNPGDGSDTVDGQAGQDTLEFNGSGGDENIDLAANGPRLRLFRNVGTITMDTNDVESVDVNALGGADTIVVNDLSGTDVVVVDVNLAAALGGATGDNQADSVVVFGRNGDDVALITGAAAGVAVNGLAAQVNLVAAEAGTDVLTVNGLAGDDVINASGLEADAVPLVADGGDGDDVLLGGQGNDTLAGGAGDDVLLGSPGNDILDGGPGDNVVLQG